MVPVVSWPGGVRMMWPGSRDTSPDKPAETACAVARVALVERRPEFQMVVTVPCPVTVDRPARLARHSEPVVPCALTAERLCAALLPVLVASPRALKPEAACPFLLPVEVQAV